MASTYPGTIDTQPTVLSDGNSIDVADLTSILEMLVAIQGEIGVEPGNFAGEGGLDFKTVGEFLRQRFRMEAGRKVMPSGSFNSSEARIDFTANRFDAPPIVLCQSEEQSVTGSGEARIKNYSMPKNITNEGFTIGWSRRGTVGGSNNKVRHNERQDLIVRWIAFSPLHGISTDAEQANG